MTMLAVLTVCAALCGARSAFAAGPPDPRSSTSGHDLTTDALSARGLAPGAGTKKSHDVQVDALVARGTAATDKRSGPIEVTTDPLVAKGIH